MMRIAALIAASLCLSTLASGCSHEETAGRIDRRPAARAEGEAGGKARLGRAKQVVVERRDMRPAFDEKDMIKPITKFREYIVDDYRKLPNCLDVFNACVAVPYDGKTSAQYKAMVQEVARRLCRVVLKVVDVSADYDYAEFEMLTDEGQSAIDTLRHAGDLAGYMREVKPVFPINNIKKKGLASDRLSVGDQIILVGLGEVVAASPWGATRYSKGLPRGDDRYVMLRAFGMPDPHVGKGNLEYEFAFMVRNWFIASQ
jgi:hypothetical protein